MNENLWYAIGVLVLLVLVLIIGFPEAVSKEVCTDAMLWAQEC